MRAAVVSSFSEPLSIEERSVPQPTAGQVVVRIEASGLCHTDIHAARGDWPVQPTPPFVPGHEGVGLIEAVGDGVPPERIGTRVAIAWLGSACGVCPHCIEGWETLCSAQQNTGYSIDGCHAEYTVADARFAVPVPDGIDPLVAAPLTCAGVTTYKAVKVAGTRPTDVVAVWGIGGLGHLAVQYAKIFGATVVALDVQEDKLSLARSLGADVTIDVTAQDPVAALQAMGGADVVLALAVSPESLRQAHASLRRGGRLVLVAMPRANEMHLPVFETVVGGISVIGSIVGTRQDLSEVFELHAAGRTTVDLQVRKLEEINEAIEDVLAGHVPARIVFEL
ncbi:MAG TPA: zinc-dependent alcohol dehydrogenase [Frankiaceae bacterium]|nr:zinc-dependent alcohol dehydrogenase [Frankiaceae bacterium]